tara:strand:- start:47 stop:463 length:417 start_codon:yes stop_codon:yes gene_type:complete
VNFRKHNRSDDPELNLIPLIDVLLVIIIFLAVSTTFENFSELKVNLPIAESSSLKSKDTPIIVTVSKNGKYAINDELLLVNSTKGLEVALLKMPLSDVQKTTLLVNADGQADYQSIISVMEASRKAGFTKIKFSTKKN